MWPLGWPAGAGRPNSGEPLAGADRARAGDGPWVLGDLLLGSVGPGKGRRGGCAGGSGCGRRGRCAGEVGVAPATWGGWRARVGAGCKCNQALSGFW
jgi:hypothetical protein